MRLEPDQLAGELAVLRQVQQVALEQPSRGRHGVELVFVGPRCLCDVDAVPSESLADWLGRYWSMSTRAPLNSVASSAIASSVASNCTGWPLEPRHDRTTSTGATTRHASGSGFPNVPWHLPRHFAATALLEAEQDLFVVSRILGHGSVSTTANFYGHVQPAMLRRSADAMDELMRKASAT